MSVRGIKRPLSDELNSPEPLLPVQPVGDSEDDQSSPESLLPLQPDTDPYSSEESSHELRLPSIAISFDNPKELFKEKDSKTLLKKRNDSSQLTAEDIHLFLNMEFLPMFVEKGSHLDDVTLETCLMQIIQFVSHGSQSAKKLKGKTATEIKETLLSDKHKSHIRWLYKNDNIDWKSSTSEVKAEKTCFFRECSKRVRTVYQSVLPLCLVVNKLYKHISRCGSQKHMMETDLTTRHLLVKRYVNALGTATNPLFKGTGDCRVVMPVYVPPDCASLAEDRVVDCVTEPHVVFTSVHRDLDVWKVVVQLITKSVSGLEQPSKCLKLTQRPDSSDVKGIHLHFYGGIHYKQQGQVLRLEEYSLEDCLHQLFMFSACQVYDCENRTFRGKTLTEIIDHYLKLGHIEWLRENDNIDWKNISQEKRKEKAAHNFNHILHDYDFPFDSARTYSLRALQLYEEICTTRTGKNTDDLNTRDRAVTRYIEALAEITGPGYIQNGDCVDVFSLYLHHGDISEQSAMMDGRHIEIATDPSGVFTTTRHVLDDLGATYRQWQIVVQVYGASDDEVLPDSPSPAFSPGLSGAFNVVSTPTTVSRESTQKIKLGTNRMLSSSLAYNAVNKKATGLPMRPPRKSTDKIQDPQYCVEVRSYIENSLMTPGLSSRCVDKMSGQHVIQLLCQADQADPDLNDNLAGFGMFVVNEHIYFSRLDVKKDLLQLIHGYSYKNANRDKRKYLNDKYKQHSPPVVSYSNWRLDVTIARHRLVLVIFLKEYLKYCSQQ